MRAWGRGDRVLLGLAGGVVLGLVARDAHLSWLATTLTQIGTIFVHWLELVQKALWWVIRLAPLGTLGLIGKAVAVYGWDLPKPLSTFAIDIYVGLALVLVVVYPLVLSLAGRVNPLKFYAGAWPAIQLGFVSRSSIGTLPMTQRVVTERLGVQKEYASFAVPFGATTKMDGCAARYPALAAIFVANVFGCTPAAAAA